MAHFLLSGRVDLIDAAVHSRVAADGAFEVRVDAVRRRQDPSLAHECGCALVLPGTGHSQTA